MDDSSVQVVVCATFGNQTDSELACFFVDSILGRTVPTDQYNGLTARLTVDNNPYEMNFCKRSEISVRPRAERVDIVLCCVDAHYPAAILHNQIDLLKRQCEHCQIPSVYLIGISAPQSTQVREMDSSNGVCSVEMVDMNEESNTPLLSDDDNIHTTTTTNISAVCAAETTVDYCEKLETLSAQFAMDGYLQLNIDDWESKYNCNNVTAMFEEIIRHSFIDNADLVWKARKIKSKNPNAIANRPSLRFIDNGASKLSQCGSLIYDILTMCISIADVCTDVWVIYRFHTAGRTAFFIIALTVVILAQLAYALAFVLRFASTSAISYKKRCVIFVCCLPISPFISFIFYWSTRKDNCISAVLEFCGLNKRERRIDRTKPKIRQWVEEKFSKHMGFILEALIEAFPQSIIQMIAILYYHETDWVNILSILISLLSVATKSLVFSMAINVKTFVFNWLSIVTDTIAFFMILSLVFYNPTNPGNITAMGEVWLWKVYCTTIPIVCWAGWALAIAFGMDFYKHDISATRKARWNAAQRFCVKSCLALSMATLWLCGAALSTLILEIGSLSYIALLLFEFNGLRWHHSSARASKFWLDLFAFIGSARDTRDRILRLCAINLHLSQTDMARDKIFVNYLQNHESTMFANVKLSDFRIMNSRGTKSTFWGQISDRWFAGIESAKDDIQRHQNTPEKLMASRIFYLWVLPATYIGFPIYVIQRLFNLVYPIVVLSVVGYANLHLLQWSLMTVYAAMTLVWWIFAVFVFREQYISYHISTGRRYFSYYRVRRMRFFDTLMRQIVGYYDRMAVAPIREKAVLRCLGPDIGSVVVEYLPKFGREVVELNIHSSEDTNTNANGNGNAIEESSHIQSSVDDHPHSPIPEFVPLLL